MRNRAIANYNVDCKEFLFAQASWGLVVDVKR